MTTKFIELVRDCEHKMLILQARQGLGGKRKLGMDYMVGYKDAVMTFSEFLVQRLGNSEIARVVGDSEVREDDGQDAKP